jgi:hypothetical protein
MDQNASAELVRAAKAAALGAAVGVLLLLLARRSA